MDISSIAPIGAMTGSFGTEPIVRPNMSPTEQRAAVGQQFEAIMLRQFLSDSVGKMLGDSGGDSSSDIYGYMLSEVFASKLASGGGMGLSKIIAQQLAPVGEGAPPPPPGQATQS